MSFAPTRMLSRGWWSASRDTAKFMGDGVLAYFGWPKAQEDAAERAVLAGLAITKAVADLVTTAGGTLVTRVGIATGLRRRGRPRRQGCRAGGGELADSNLPRG